MWSLNLEARALDRKRASSLSFFCRSKWIPQAGTFISVWGLCPAGYDRGPSGSNQLLLLFFWLCFVSSGDDDALHIWLKIFPGYRT